MVAKNKQGSREKKGDLKPSSGNHETPTTASFANLHTSPSGRRVHGVRQGRGNVRLRASPPPPPCTHPQPFGVANRLPHRLLIHSLLYLKPHRRYLSLECDGAPLGPYFLLLMIRRPTYADDATNGQQYRIPRQLRSSRPRIHVTSSLPSASGAYCPHSPSVPFPSLPGMGDKRTTQAWSHPQSLPYR